MCGGIASTFAFQADYQMAVMFIILGAVFDFFAGTVKRAPEAWQRAGLEWLYRLVKEPRRMWRRYLLGNVQFLLYMLEEKIKV